jgi:cytoskeletal protein CcmA (bactofilin family)
MFSAKKNNGTAPLGAMSIIGSGVTLTGDINSTADIRIDGILKGNIKSTARVFIGSDAVVEGEIESEQADIHGQVRGNVKVKDVLNLRASASLTGDIHAGKLQVEPSANFNGHCYMNTNVIVEMIHEVNDQPKANAR